MNRADEADRTVLILAEFASAQDVLRAAQSVRDAGYVNWDAHTPFPVHGMDRAMGLKDSVLGWIVLGCALTGLASAFWMMHWMNGIDYPLVVGDKPPGAPLALPAMIPILFELTILLSAFGAVFGMLGLNGLPRLHHPLFESERFQAASDDKFFISIEARDPRFEADRTRTLLERMNAVRVEFIREGAS
jgi:hypothetical protein